MANRILTKEQIEKRKSLLNRKWTIATETIEKFNEAKAKVVWKTFTLYASYSDFAKSDDEKRLVKGIASSEAIDCYWDIVRFSAMKEAFDDYMEFANIREMHWPSAVGTVKSYEFDEENKSTIIEAKIVDDNAWNKVKEWVYKWFSIGWRVVEAEPLVIKTYDEDGNEYEQWTWGLDITKLELVEISVVDRPANPDALIETYKASNAEGFMPEIAFVSKETATGEIAKVEKSENVLSDKDDAMLKEVRDKVAKFFKGQDVDIEAMSDEDKVEVSKADLYNLVKDFVKDAVAEEENAEASDDAENEEKEEETPAEETPAEEDEKSEEVEEEKAEEEKAEETTEVEKEDDAEEVKPEEEKPEEETPAEEKAEEVKEETEVEKSNAVDFKAEFAKMSEVLEKKFGERLDKIEKMIWEKDESINEMLKKAGFSTQVESTTKKEDSVFKWIFNI